MNNFHIYEEVGRGKYSVVYKVSLTGPLQDRSHFTTSRLRVVHDECRLAARSLIFEQIILT